jgi:hypothetical protein
LLDLGIEMGILGAGFDGIKDVYDMMHKRMHLFDFESSWNIHTQVLRSSYMVSLCFRQSQVPSAVKSKRVKYIEASMDGDIN